MLKNDNYMPLKKQIELFGIIYRTFYDKIENDNCLKIEIIKEVLHDKLHEKGFYPIDAELFSSAKIMFSVGRDINNNVCIELQGYSRSTNFITETINSGISEDIQYAVFSIVETNFMKEMAIGNNIPLINIIRKVQNDFLAKNIKTINKDLFLKMPRYFFVGKDMHGRPSVIGKKYLWRQNIEGNIEQKKFFKYLYNNVNSLEIAFKDFVYNLNRSGYPLPDEYENYEHLFSDMCENYGFAEFRNTEGEPKEPHLILRRPKCIPLNVRQQVELVVKNNYYKDQIVSNSLILDLLIKNGIRYKDYLYPSVTAFLRTFPNLFSIIVNHVGNNKYNVSARILVGESKKEPNHDKEKFNNDMLMKAQAMTKEENHEEPLQVSFLQDLLNCTSLKVWNIAVNELRNSNVFPFQNPISINEWEFLVMTFGDNVFEKSKDVDFLRANGVNEKEIPKIASYIHNYKHEKDTFSILAKRVADICNNKILALALWAMGICISKGQDKKQGIVNYVSFCGLFYPDKVPKLWDSLHKNLTSLAPTRMLLQNLFSNECFDGVIYVYNNLNEDFAIDSRIKTLCDLSKYILQNNDEKCELNKVKEFSSGLVLMILQTLLKYTLKNEQIGKALNILSYITDDEEIKRELVWGNMLREYKKTISLIYDSLLTSAQNGELKSWHILRFLDANIDDDNLHESLDKVRYSCKLQIRKKLEECSNDDEKHTINNRARNIFPEDERFLDDCFKELKEELLSASIDEIKTKCMSLMKNNEYTLVWKIYENNIVDLSEEWFVDYVIQCARANLKYENAIDLICKQLSIHQDDDFCKNKTFTNICDVVWEAHKNNTLIQFSRYQADLLLPLFSSCDFDKASEGKVQFAALILALSLKNRSLSCLLYALVNSQGIANEVLVEIGKSLLEAEDAFSKKLYSFEKVLLHTLKVENIANIFCFLKILSRLIQYSQYVTVETNKTKILGLASDKKRVADFIRTFIINWESEFAWRALSKYSADNKESGVNFVSNIILMLKFNDITLPLSNCTTAVEKWTSDSMPGNFLVNNVILLQSEKHIPSYWEKFVEHIKKNKNFENTKDEIVDAYFTVLKEKHKLTATDCSLLICILEQSKAYEKFYDIVMKNNDSFKEYLVSNSVVLIKFLTAILTVREYRSSNILYNELTKYAEEINPSDITEEKRTILFWLGWLCENFENNRFDKNIFRISQKILMDYPYVPNKNILEQIVFSYNQYSEEYFTMLDFLVNGFHNVELSNSVLRHILRNTFKIGDAYKTKIYKLEKSIFRIIILKYDPKTNWQIYDYLRLCQSYYATKILTEDNSDESQQFIEGMKRGFKDSDQYSEVIEYKKVLDKLSESNVPSKLKEQLLVAGITNYWDDILYDALNLYFGNSYTMKYISDYILCIHTLGIKRRLWQMFLFPYIAYYRVQNIGIEKFKNIKEKEIEEYSDRIKAEEYNFSEEIDKLCSFVNSIYSIDGDVSEESIGMTMNNLHSLQDVDVKISLLEDIYFVIINKKWDKIADIALKNPNQINESRLRLLTYVHEPKNIHKILNRIANTDISVLEKFLNSQSITNIIGDMWTCYFSALLAISKGNFEYAENILENESRFIEELDNNIHLMREAIKNRSPLTNLRYHGEFKKYIEKPKYSFMKEMTSESENIKELQVYFYSENNLYDAHQKCTLAQKIYYCLNKGESIRDFYDFVYKWGFYAIEIEIDLQKRLDILIELLQDLDNLKKKDSYKAIFVKEFIALLNNLKYQVLIKNIGKLSLYCKLIYKNFGQFDNYQCYVRLLMNLEELWRLSQETTALQEAENIRKTILAIHLDNPDIYFAELCVEFVDQFISQIKAHGVLEVKILNEENVYSGAVFYQIKNLGAETISEIKVNIYISGIQENSICKEKTIISFKLSEKLLGGLRPGQVFPGEYRPQNITVKENDVLQCIIQVEYNNKNYIAVDGNNGGLLTCHKEEYHYSMSPYAGYKTSALNKEEISKFQGRGKEINEIKRIIANNENPLLYGTNGTGKTSILNQLKGKYIQDICKEIQIMYGENCKPIIIDVFVEENCTKSSVIDSLLKNICTTNCLLIDRVNALQRKDPERDYTDTLKCLEATIERRNSLNINGTKDIGTESMQELFLKISEALEYSQIRLFLLWDNFERVISSKNIVPEEMLFLKDLSDKISNNIRFVFSGSNFLLEAVCVEGAEWGSILSRATTSVKIGNLLKDDFYSLMKQPIALNNGEIHYCDDALSYLWEYTKGHPFYSCMLGTRILKILDFKGVHRKCIYPSDVYAAIYMDDNVEFDRSQEKTIESQIFQDIYNNTAVKYIGKRLANAIMGGDDTKTYLELQEIVLKSRPDINEEAFETAIGILEARDFIKNEDNGRQNADKKQWARYSFTNDLYLERFLYIDVPEAELNEENQLQQERKEAFDLFAAFMKKASFDEIKKAKLFMGDQNTNYQGAHNEVHGNLDQSKTINSNIYIQNLTNTFNTLLLGDSNPESIKSALAAMPKLIDYIDVNKQPELDRTKKRLLKGQESLDELYSEREDLISEQKDISAVDEDIEVQERSNSIYTQRIEETILPAREKMANETLGAAIAVGELELSDDRWAELLKLDCGSCQNPVKILKDRLSDFGSSLGFAVILHNVFDKISQKSSENKLDYSPVALMYCKLVEAVLKAKHLTIYVKKLGDETVKYGGPCFNDLVDKNGNIKNGIIHNNVTMGSFVHPITIKPKKKNDKKITPNMDNIRKITGNTDDNASVNCTWQKSAKSLKIIADIRNKTAHEIEPITKSTFEKLIDELFTQGELQRIVELAKEC